MFRLSFLSTLVRQSLLFLAFSTPEYLFSPAPGGPETRIYYQEYFDPCINMPTPEQKQGQQLAALPKAPQKTGIDMNAERRRLSLAIRRLSRVFDRVEATAYCPENTRQEGGPKDSLGNMLAEHTVQAYLRKLDQHKLGAGDYVAISMDRKLQHGSGALFPTGTYIRVPQLEAYVNKFLRKGKQLVRFIRCRVVDCGGALLNKGTGLIDICFANSTLANAFGRRGKYTFYKISKPT